MCALKDSEALRYIKCGAHTQWDSFFNFHDHEFVLLFPFYKLDFEATEAKRLIQGRQARKGSGPGSEPYSTFSKASALGSTGAHTAGHTEI